MNTGIQHLHHYLPYIFLIVLIVSILRAYLGKIENPKKDKLLLVTLILAHIQLLLGLHLIYQNINIDWASVMKDSDLRFRFIEHPTMMLLGVLLITIGKLKAKKIEDVTKANKTIFSYFWIALVLIALRTPWDKLF